MVFNAKKLFQSSANRGLFQIIVVKGGESCAVCFRLPQSLSAGFGLLASPYY